MRKNTRQKLLSLRQPSTFYHIRVIFIVRKEDSTAKKANVMSWEGHKIRGHSSVLVAASFIYKILYFQILLN